MDREDVIRDIRDRYQQDGQELNERQRRLWAATEAMKLGRGGITIISKSLLISPNTIKKGMHEILTGQVDSLSCTSRGLRKAGGGRKSRQATSDPPEIR